MEFDKDRSVGECLLDIAELEPEALSQFLANLCSGSGKDLE
jgi:hypothetical protein